MRKLEITIGENFEVTIGEDQNGKAIVFVKGSDPKKVTAAYLDVKKSLSPQAIAEVIKETKIKEKK